MLNRYLILRFEKGVTFISFYLISLIGVLMVSSSYDILQILLNLNPVSLNHGISACVNILIVHYIQANISLYILF